jgi:hypothetical protein
MKTIAVTPLLILTALAACSESDVRDEHPTVAITSPDDFSTVTGVVQVVAVTSDDKGIQGVTFALDGVDIGDEVTQVPYQVELDTRPHPDGEHVIRATARDTADQIAYTEVRVTFENGTRRLITWADIETSLVGTFVIPQSQDGDYRFGYSTAVHTQLDSGNLIVTGHSQYEMQAEVQLPEVFDGSEATRVGDWMDYTGGLLPLAWEGGEAYVVGGMLQIGDRLHFTKNQWYNGSGADWETQGYREGDTAYGMWKVDGQGAHHQRVGGYMTYAPAVLVADGVTYLAGMEGTSGAADGRWGPNLFAISLDDTIEAGQAQPSQPLIYHDSEENAPENWWIGDKVSDVEWIESGDAHGVVFFLYQKLGTTWYGEADEGGIDPYGGYKGYHAEGYQLKVWIYHPDDLLAVYNGEADPWSLHPAEEVILTDRQPGSEEEVYNSFFTGTAKEELQVSLQNGRMIILQPDGHRDEFEGMPKGYVLQLE